MACKLGKSWANWPLFFLPDGRQTKKQVNKAHTQQEPQLNRFHPLPAFRKNKKANINVILNIIFAYFSNPSLSLHALFFLCFSAWPKRKDLRSGRTCECESFSSFWLLAPRLAACSCIIFGRTASVGSCHLASAIRGLLGSARTTFTAGYSGALK